MKLTKQVQEAILKHVDLCAPSESCGFVLQSGRKQSYYPCINVAALPNETFEISADDWIAAEQQGEVQAVVHSHPNNEPYLSGADRVSMHQSKLPWALVTGGEIKTFRYAPLLRGRVFEYGVNDCFTLVRDAYMLGGLNFRDHERGNIDADAEARSFENNLPDGGFTRVEDLQTGDLILTAYSGVPNHVMLYIGHGEVIHHAYDRLSAREVYTQALRRRAHSVWRHREWKPEMIEGVKNDLENSIRNIKGV